MQYGFLSLVPPLLTILLALLTKNVFISLFIGILTGSFVLNAFSPLVSVSAGLNAIVDSMSGSNVIIIASCLIVGAVIHLMERSGGIEGFVHVVVKSKGVIRTKRGANLFTWLLGLAVFTSGSLSCMVTGAVSRPVNDALKVPHEKSAFLVHTTSTPWCVLFPFSGWLASMAGYLVSGGVSEGESVAVLFQSLPFNFYCILAILLALFVSISQKDFGPMAAAEKRAAETEQLDAPGHGTAESVQASASDVKPRACNLLLPVGVLIVTIFTALIATGWAAAETTVQVPVIREIARAGVAITKGSGMQALLWAVVLSLLTILIMTVCQKVFTLDQAISEMFKGMGHMLPIAFILLFGFTMGTVVKGLDTGSYLSYLFQKLLSPALLPALTFLIAMLISFATGTSMGTMAIMAVISLPMASQMGVSIPLVAGAMYGGSIFGDHCSPISDTTIMTCSTTGCDIIDHVKTQAPYCVSIAVISFVLYVIFGFVL
ncbi:MAG: Na+/H+ antiporter NhaC family protein [Candidatus Faecousia sp.]|nr:Na+/H+ antiporter NhaC family protein [Candidatus Faecousia sp.]